MVFHRWKAYDKIINEDITRYRRIEFKRTSRVKRSQYACVHAVLYVNARGNRLLLSPFLQNTTPRSPIYRSLKRVDHRDRGGLHARAHVLDPSKKEGKEKKENIPPSLAIFIIFLFLSILPPPLITITLVHDLSIQANRLLFLRIFHSSIVDSVWLSFTHNTRENTHTHATSSNTNDMIV